MSVNLLSIRGLRQSYPAGFLGLGRRKVLLDVGLELGAGERVLIAGPNGSGKSTLLRILAGVEAPDAGTAALLGRHIDSREARRRIGYAPDGCPFPPELSASAMMRIAGELAGLAAREARLKGARMLARVGLEADAKRRLGHFSKGMQRRFTLGAALLSEPNLLLLDEPTDGLDAEGFGVLDEFLDEARARGAGVLFASHVAVLACDRVHILWEGRIQRSGSPGELVSAQGGLLATYAELAAGAKE